MTTQYTPKLKLALPVQGELSGTWGDVVNENITSMLEEAIAGRSVIDSWTTNAHVLTEADGTTAESRSAMLEFTDTGVALTGAATVTCPAISKIYICKNDSGQQVTITTAAGTGVDIPDGATMLVFCDGTNVVEGTTNVNSLTYQGYTVTFGGNFTTANSFTTAGDFALTLTATGATNVTLPTTGTLATLDGTETFTNKTFTSPTITSPTMTGSISATDLDISGDTTIGDAAADTLTITATVTSNITFTDDTYDIGADGATRPRSLYLSQDLVVGDAAAITGNTTVGGTLGVTGNVAVNTDKVTIEATTGNTAIAGTLGVTGNITASAALVTDTISEKTATSGVTIDGVVLKDGGATVTGDITFGDNDKAIFGAGSDLQIYHSGSVSVIDENGTGNLYIKASDLRIQSSTGESYIECDQDSGVTIRHDNLPKLATTSTGIDVTGTATMDGLTVDGVAGNMATFNGTLGDVTISADGAAVSFTRPSTTYLRASDAVGNLSIQAGGNINRALFTNNGDISFYEDTGTTAKFFWDASAERLGIGTSSPSRTLTVVPPTRTASLASNGFVISDLTTATMECRQSTTENSWYSNTAMAFATANTERMRIDSSGNVGIGTSSPVGNLDVYTPTTSIGYVRTANQTLKLTADDAGSRVDIANSASSPISFTTGVTERMRIDSSGNLLVGTTSFPSGTNTGASIQGDGLVYGSRNGSTGGAPSIFNRTSNDGDITVFRKDGTTVGSIGTINGDMFLGTGNTGIRFTDSAEDIRPVSSSGANLDATLDLGVTGCRFKDLHLSGTVNIANWDINDDGSGNLMFSVSGVNKMRLNADGSLDVAGDINANATL